MNRIARGTWRALGMVGLMAALAVGLGLSSRVAPRMGRQPDGSFVVSTGQRIGPGTIAFDGRPSDLAHHPTAPFFAVMNKTGVFLVDGRGVRSETIVPFLGANAGFTGLEWTPNGRRLFASTDKGYIQGFRLARGRLILDKAIRLQKAGTPGNAVPGGMAIRRDGSRLYAVGANLNAVVEIDLDDLSIVRSIPVENLPFEVKLSDDEKSLVVSNWGGHLARPGEATSASDKLEIAVDGRDVTTSGSVSIVDLAGGTVRHVEVGLHPTGIAVAGNRAYVANAMSDTISEIDLGAATVVRTIPLAWGDLRVIGGMPNALAIQDKTLYVADGGDNALAEVDLESGTVRGFRPAGYFPVAVEISRNGRNAFVLNSKGNGSVARILRGGAGNVHDFQGTVSRVNLTSDIKGQTEVVARNNRWDDRPGKPPLKVYNGAIKHVVYIIKENRTYDEVFGDLPIGNGEPRLCSLGETVMPNHRKIAREFTLFDNGYVSGTNSADGHAWSTQALANEYLEHFYVGYSRTYSDAGQDPMAISSGGSLWDAALAKGKTLRVWGEFCDELKAVVEPEPADWFEVWEDRLKKTNKFKFRAVTNIPSLRPYICPNYLFWPLLQSDQHRADIFIEEYNRFSREDEVPELMILSLPADHAEGTNPKYPTPRAMMADNDLALGRIVQAISTSPQWKDTCIFVIEDDAQSGPDHVDGHRTVFLAISPYMKRKYLDSSLYTTTGMIRSIELMLGLDPMNKFDALADPLIDCFTDEPDPTPYAFVANTIPLDERSPEPTSKQFTEADRYWQEKTASLDWTKLDAPDPYWLNRINWYSIFKGTRPYPERPGEVAGMADPDGDDDD